MKESRDAIAISTNRDLEAPLAAKLTTNYGSRRHTSIVTISPHPLFQNLSTRGTERESQCNLDFGSDLEQKLEIQIHTRYVSWILDES